MLCCFQSVQRLYCVEKGKLHDVGEEVQTSRCLDRGFPVVQSGRHGLDAV